MKTIIVALAIIGYTFAAQGLPAATSYCMGNVDDATTCSSCYNYGLGTINPRILSAAACGTAATTTVLVTDCLWYRGDLGAARTPTDCGKCNSKAWQNVDTNASPNTIACSATVSDASCTTVTNCDQQYCLKTAANTFAAGCRMCSSGFRGNATTVGVTAVGFPTCTTASSAIANCTYYNPLDGAKCYLCGTGFAVNTTDNGCVAFTTDANCRKLGNTAATYYCGQCKNNYYFTTTTCTLGYDATTAATTGANMMALSAAFLALAAFFN
jgi:hypothetical protein